jgi:alkaline phosphatase D
MEAILAQEPELFLFAGDNIYADSTDPQVIRREYHRLEDRPDFRRLRRSATLLATWDDHDYGANDAGRSFTAREASEEIFETFWGIPEDHAARKRPGIYYAVEADSPVGRVQIVVLDTRYFRSPLRWVRIPTKTQGPYAPNTSPDATLLGKEQWKWLRGVFRRPARLRIVVSSIQFAAEHHGYECWANFPLDQQRMLDLVAEQAPGSVLFISGDRHFAELSRITIPGWGPVYDLTSSSLNRPYPHDEPTPNANRVGDYYLKENWGRLRLVSGASPRIELRIFAADGTTVLRFDVPFR